MSSSAPSEAAMDNEARIARLQWRVIEAQHPRAVLIFCGGAITCRRQLLMNLDFAAAFRPLRYRRGLRHSPGRG